MDTRTVFVLSGVLCLFLSALSQSSTPTATTTGATVRANTLHYRGITGAGALVAVLEINGGRIPTSHPFLNIVHDNDLNYGCISAHTANVVGVIKSNHCAVRGIAYGATVLVTGPCDENVDVIRNRTQYAVDWGARVLNLSWGGVNYLDDYRPQPEPQRDGYFDRLVSERRCVVVSAAGNNGHTDGKIGSPGLAYNLITVGSFDDQGTAVWGDDKMAGTSSWLNPLSANGDREKPELVAPGVNLCTTTETAPWIGCSISGTSLAAPVVSGVIALLIQANPQLIGKPEAVKAVLMASAVHNIEGVSTLVPGQDLKDGAGSIRADVAYQLVAGIDGIWGQLDSYACNAPDVLDLNVSFLRRGERVRAVITWAQNYTYQNYKDQPSADLDVRIVNSANTVIAYSGTRDNNFELVDFIVPNDGNYRLQVIKVRCDAPPQYLGWAWVRVPPKQEYRFVDLHPTGFSHSAALAASQGQQAGWAAVGGQHRAMRWAGSALSAVNMHPTGFDISQAYDIFVDDENPDDWRVVGPVWKLDDLDIHAFLWMPGSTIDIGADYMVSYNFENFILHGVWQDTVGGYFHGAEIDGVYYDSNAAFLWTRTPFPIFNILTDYAGAYEIGTIHAIWSNYQVGSIYAPNRFGILDHVAAKWSGNIESVLSLHPPNHVYSQALGIYESQIVGYAYSNAAGSQAFLWTGSNHDRVNLHPQGFSFSSAAGTNGIQQVGSGRLPGMPNHALLWAGSAASLIDLHQFLPVGHSSSHANDIDVLGFIVGSMTNGCSSQIRAIFWKLISPNDINGDGCVDDDDVLAVLFAFGSMGMGLREDIDGDGIVGDDDFLSVLFDFGSGC